MRKFPPVYIPIFSYDLSLEQLSNAVSKVSARGAVEKVNQFLPPAYTPNIRGSQFQKTPFHNTAHSNNTQAVKLLLERGAKIEARDEDKFTPLHFAAQNNSTEAAQLLLEHGADFNASDVKNLTPLALARSICNEAVIRLLMEHTANTP